jgi:hypothetical protein
MTARSQRPIKSDLPLRVVLIDPPPDVDYGIQRGRGSRYEPVFVQQRKRGDVTFDFCVTVDQGKGGAPVFSGEYVQGTPARRFIYIDVGTYAGQKNTPWSRRMIVLLTPITSEQVTEALKPGHRLSASIQGTGKDGGPSCATVPLINGWQVIRG